MTSKTEYKYTKLTEDTAIFDLALDFRNGDLFTLDDCGDYYNKLGTQNSLAKAFVLGNLYLREKLEWEEEALDYVNTTELMNGQGFRIGEYTLTHLLQHYSEDLLKVCEFVVDKKKNLD